MGSGNGMASAYGTQQPPDAYNAPQPTETAVVKIDLGLSGRQILAGFTAICTFLVSAAAAGWVFLPARQTDLEAVSAIVRVVQQEQTKNQEIVSRLVLAVDNLASVVDQLKNAPPRTIERYLPRPSKMKSLR
jgi:hypothetical protein